MKQIKMTVIGLALVAGMAVCSAQAQTNTTTPAGFFGSLKQYATSFSDDTNQWWSGTTWELSTGYKQVTGAGAQNQTSIQKDWSALNVGLDMQYSGVGSAVNGVEVGPGYAFIQYKDFKMDVNLRGGFGMNSQLVKCGVIEPGITIAKLQTYNTATRVGMSFPIYFKGKFDNTPTFLITETIRFKKW